MSEPRAEQGHIEKEQRSKVIVVAPPGWGGEKITRDTYFAIMCNPHIRASELGKHAVEQAIRKQMEESGIIVQESDNPVIDPDNENQFVVLCREESIQNADILVKEAAPDLVIPKQLTLEQFQEMPFFPAVASFEGLAGGMGKYLLETEAQWEIFNRFLNTEGKQIRDGFVFKEFISTPSDRYTSYRVLVSAKGRIIASGLLYSGDTKSHPTFAISSNPKDILELAGISLFEYLEIPSSPFFLGSKRFVSNTSRGGNCIPLNPGAASRAITKQETEIARAHGIGPDMQLPEVIARQARAIGASLGKRMGLIVGIDFIQDEDGNVYYLETNADPGMKTYLALKNRGAGTEIEGYRMIMEEVIQELIGS